VSYLQEVANRYSARADRIVKRHTTEEGVFDADFQPHVDYYRNASAAVSRLTEGLEEGGETEWNLDREDAYSQKFAGKVSTRDKAATPQELIAKAS
jgi:hypothetical protein